MNNHDLFLHSLARFRSSQDNHELMVWNEIHHYDICLALHEAYLRITSKKTKLVIIKEPQDLIKHFILKTEDDHIDLFGTNALERFEQQRFTEDPLYFEEYSNIARLNNALTDSNFFLFYLPSSENFKDMIVEGIFMASEDYSLPVNA